MPATTLRDVLNRLRQTWAAQAARDLSDGELLKRYAVDGEDAAFTVLVQRHGAMVLAVGRRVLGDAHAAEDVFQATFMVLVVPGGVHQQAATAERLALHRRPAPRRQNEGSIDGAAKAGKPGCPQAAGGLRR